MALRSMGAANEREENNARLTNSDQSNLPAPRTARKSRDTSSSFFLVMDERATKTMSTG